MRAYVCYVLCILFCSLCAMRNFGRLWLCTFVLTFSVKMIPALKLPRGVLLCSGASSGVCVLQIDVLLPSFFYTIDSAMLEARTRGAAGRTCINGPVHISNSSNI